VKDEERGRVGEPERVAKKNLAASKDVCSIKHY